MGYSIAGTEAFLGDEPFFWIRLDREGLAHLRGQLDQCGRRERGWFTLIATRDNPRRLRLKEEPTPAFEAGAAPNYLRGELFRVSGREGVSCNIAFSSRGAAQLSECAAAAGDRMRRFVELRVPSRRHALVEFRADTDPDASPSDEDCRLGAMGEAAAAQTLAFEDFADWEPGA